MYSSCEWRRGASCTLVPAASAPLVGSEGDRCSCTTVKSEKKLEALGGGGKGAATFFLRAWGGRSAAPCRGLPPSQRAQAERKVDGQWLARGQASAGRRACPRLSGGALTLVGVAAVRRPRAEVLSADGVAIAPFVAERAVGHWVEYCVAFAGRRFGDNAFQLHYS